LYVQNLVVEDVEHDDGSGLMVKFEPLPREARIIEYRIYRGINPDTLFYLGKIEVDARTGFQGDEVIFLDKDFRPFVDIESPRRLRHEKGQKKGSPIFRAIPREMRILGPLLEHFSLLAIIDKNVFYRKTQMYYSVGEDGHTELLGGLRVEDFETIVANVLPGKKYYYTVIAVNDRRKFLPHAPIVSGIASDNMPSIPEKFYAVWVKDSHLNFEFEFPLFVDDLMSYSIYMIHSTEASQLQRYRDYMSDLDRWVRVHTEGDTLAVMPDVVENPGRLLHVINSSFPFTSLNYGSVHYQDGYLINVSDGTQISFSPNRIDDYLFFLSFDDYAGFQAISDPIPAVVIEYSQLPTLPDFEVRDKPNSKGDAVEIIIGKPIAMITQINFRGRGRDRTSLQVAYEYSKIPNVRVRSITFDFVDHSGNSFMSVTEHYIDNLFNLSLPSTNYFDEGFSVYISFDAPGSEIHQQRYLQQFISFDEDLEMLRAGNLIVDGVYVQNYRYQIIKKAISDRNFRAVNRITPLVNFFDDFIPYEKYIFKGIHSYNLETNHLLFDTFIDIGFDETLGSTVMTNLFYNEFIAFINSEIEYFSNILADDPDNEEARGNITFYEQILCMQENHPHLKDINKITNHRKRISQIINTRETLRRSFKYYIVKTDGEGSFVVSDIFVDQHGVEYIFPKPNWFNFDSWPMLIASLVFGLFVMFFFFATKTDKMMYIRPIAGLEEVDNAIGRATEMGRPILFVPGLSSIGDVATLAGLSILGHITRKAAQYDTRIIVPVADYIVLPIAQQIVKEAHYTAGRPDSFNPNDIFFVAGEQFAYVAGVNGVMIREKTATNFYMGYFFAEALIMTETGNNTGAIQVAGTDALTQIPFFITTCDYTLLGEELYGASAYLTRDPVIVGTLKSQDYTKLVIIICIVVGTILSTLNLTGMINWFPAE
jgi:hypothetical protein